jgi:hypothetical protein
MPDPTALAVAALLNSGIGQYPDPKIYQAASLLQPAERPTVPVRPEHTKFSQGDQRIAWVDQIRDPGVIHMSQDSPAYKKQNFPALAAALAHEQVHVAGQAGQGGRPDLREIPAFERERSVLQRLAPKQNQQRLKDIDHLIDYYRPYDQKNAPDPEVDRQALLAQMQK